MSNIRHGATYISQVLQDIERNGFGFLMGTITQPDEESVTQFLNQTLAGVPLSQMVMCSTYDKISDFTHNIGPLKRDMTPERTSPVYSIILGDASHLFVFALLMSDRLPSYQKSIGQLKSEYDIYYDIDKGKFVSDVTPSHNHMSIFGLCDQKQIMRKQRELSENYFNETFKRLDDSLSSVTSHMLNFTVATTSLDAVSGVEACSVNNRILNRKLG